MPALLPAVLTPILQLYSQLIQQRLPNLIDAFYIVGSLALGEFNEHFSDVDFLAVIHQRATAGEIETLRSIHQEVERTHPRWKLSGVYLPIEDLGKGSHTVEKPVGYHDGVVKVQDNYEMNPVTWWILKKRGIAVLGTDAEHLPFDVQWIVLGILRQFYTFHENAITTKQRAGEYGLDKIPGRWHTLIREALRIRTKAAHRSYYLFRVTRALEAIRFLKYIIPASNEYLAKLPTEPRQPLEVI